MTVPTLTDSIVEGNETFTGTISTVTGQTGVTLDTSAASAAGTITNATMALVSVTGGSAAEGSAVTFTVAMKDSTGTAVTATSAISVDFVTSTATGDTATAGSDYTAVSNTASGSTALTITAGNSSTTVTVPTLTDSIVEGNETFTGTISTVTGQTGVTLDTSAASAAGTITNATMALVSVTGGSAAEGSAVTFTVAMKDSTGTAVTATSAISVDFVTSTATGDTATAGSDYTAVSNTASGSTALTITAGNSSTTVTVPTLTDSIVEGNETFTGTISTVTGQTGVTLDTSAASAAGTITNATMALVSVTGGSAAEGSAVTFTVAMKDSTGTAVTATSAISVDFVTSTATGDTATAGSDYTAVSNTASGSTALTITAGNSSTTVTVPTLTDSIVEGNETFTGTISTVTGQTGVTLDTSAASAAGTITNATMALVSVTGGSAAEGSAVTFTVAMKDSTGTAVTATSAISVDFVTSTATGDTATAGSDYTAVSNTASGSTALTITAGNSSTTVTVPTLTDSIVEGNETFTGTISTVTGQTGVTLDTSAASAAGTITNTTMASDRIVLSVDPMSVNEERGQQSVTVTAKFGTDTVLTEATVVTVEVTGNTASADDFAAVTDFTVTIEAMASSGMKTFTLTPSSDVLMEGDETVTVSGTATGFMVTGTEVTIIDDKVGARKARTAVNREVLPQVTQAMAASTVTAVTGRIDAVTSGVGQVPSYNLATQQTLAGVMQTVSQGLGDGSLTIERLLGGSSFVLPLHAANDGQQTGLGSLAIWGRGDYLNLGGGDDIDWDGEIFSGHLGVDTRLSADLLVGLAASLSKGSFDYAGLSGTDTTAGSYTTRMTSVHPYVNWSSPAGVDLWGSLGYGWGKLGIDIQGEPQTEVSDTTMQTAAVGANGKVLSMAGLIPGGTTILRLKGEALLTKIKVEGDGGGIEPLSLEARRFRLALEGSHEHQLASGGRLVPAVEIGVRHDGGDGVEGTGLELGGGLRYVDPTIGLTIDGRGRGLVTYGEQEYREWGASLLIRMDPGAAGQGLSFNVMPAYGQTASGVTKLWDQGMDGFGEASTSDASARLEAVVGYGLPTWEGTGLLTPYSGVTLGSGGHQLRLGSTLAVGSSFNVSLEGTQAMRSEATSREATPVYGVRLQADWRF